MPPLRTTSNHPLALARIRAGLTQAELGERLNIGKAFVSRIEAGQRPIPPDRLEEFAAVLGCEVGNLRPDRFLDLNKDLKYLLSSEPTAYLARLTLALAELTSVVKELYQEKRRP